MITNPADKSSPDYKQELRAILDDTPSYDPALDLTAAQVGSALNELIARIEHLSQP
jgi:hypothetical protein